MYWPLAVAETSSLSEAISGMPYRDLEVMRERLIENTSILTMEGGSLHGIYITMSYTFWDNLLLTE